MPLFTTNREPRFFECASRSTGHTSGACSFTVFSRATVEASVACLVRMAQERMCLVHHFLCLAHGQSLGYIGHLAPLLSLCFHTLITYFVSDEFFGDIPSAIDITFDMGSSQDNRGPEITALMVTFLVLTIISVSLRFFVRIRITKEFKGDDWLMGVSLVG
jgi:hypothetical protein